MSDPYVTLNVARSATAEEIRKAYRRLAKKLHPDLNPGDKSAEAQFKAVSAAHDLLSDPDKRRRFDAGEIDADGHELPPRNYWHRHAAGPEAGRYRPPPGGGGDFADIGGIFAEMFGRGSDRAGDGEFAAPHDISASLTVPFLLAARGGKQRVELPQGRTLDIEIPEGASDRQMLRLRGQGGGEGRHAGDLYVELHILPHAFFERRDCDIHMALPVSLREAVLGGRVRVPTVGGAVMLNIPAGSNSGDTLRLKGRGLLDRRSAVRGDQYVRLRIVLPPKPDAALKSFLENWQADAGHDPRADMEQFL